MKKAITIILFLSLQACALAQTSPASSFGRPMLPGAQTTLPQNDAAATASDPAQPFLDMGKEMIVNQRFTESKEALRTALRLAPMNLQLWSLYDEAVIGEFSERRRKDKLSPIIDRDIKPVFSIDRIDSYTELGTLYIIGSITNVSDSDRINIKLTARILDENQRELRRETGALRNTERGLSPNESSLFEIPFKNPPVGGKSFRVEVSSYN